MDLPESAATFDHIAHGLFDLVIPALVGWALVWVRRQWGGETIERLIKRAAGLSYTAMLARGAGVAGMESAIGEGVTYVKSQAAAAIEDRGEIAERIRGELGVLLAARETKP